MLGRTGRGLEQGLQQGMEQGADVLGRVIDRMRKGESTENFYNLECIEKL